MFPKKMKNMAKILVLLLALLAGAAGAVTDTFTTAGNFTWTAPVGVTSVAVEAWGAGGGGGAATGNPAKGGGAAGGQYVRKVVAVTPGNTYAIVVGAGGAGGVDVAGGVGGGSTFAAATVVAKGGAGGGLAAANNSGGTAGLGSTVGGIGDIVYAGGGGSAGAASAGVCNAGGAGGGGAGSTGAGGNAVGNTAGTGTASGGGNGGAGLTARGAGNAGFAAGGGGGGGCATTGQNQNGGAGASGRVDITYTLPASVISINCVGTCMTNAGSVSWTVTFNTSVTGVNSGNFTPVPVGLGGTPAITSVTGSGTTWTVTASTGTGDGTLRLDMIDSGGVSPTVTNLPFTGQVYTIDRTVPMVSAITRVDPSPTALASVSWNVTFSESVTGVDATDFALVWGGGAGGGVITSVTGSGAAWIVTASTGASNGTLGLNLVDDDSIFDVAANPLGGAGAGNGNFTGEVYALNFTAPSFVFTNNPCVHNIAFGAVGQTCALVVWSPQVAGQDLPGVYITAVNAAGVPTWLHASQVRTRDMQFGLTCHDPVANAGIPASFAWAASFQVCQPNGGTPAIWSAIVTVTFNAGSPSSAASYIFNYADVGKVELWMRNSAATTQVGYSGPFVVKPGVFVLSSIQQTAAPNTPNSAAADATGAKFVKAGEAFSVTVTATTCSPASATCTVVGMATPNYGKETVSESVKLTPTLVGGLGLTNNPVVGGTFGAFANGVATGTAFTWNEVGIITLTPSVADADYLGAGDVAGTTTGNVGRFYAAQFALSGGVIANRTGLGGVCAVAGCDTFTYMGEQMSAMFTLTAQAIDGTTTLQNYNYSATAANNFAKLDPTAIGNPLALAAVDTGTPRTVATLDTTTYGVASGSFAGGIASVTAPFAVARGASPSGPFDALEFGVAPVDGDGAALATLDLAVNAGGAPNTHGKVGSTTKARYGRMKLSNAHGSELLNLSIPMEAQYWQGQYWAQNSLDDATTIIQDNIRLATISGPAVTISGVIKDAAGKWRIVLNKPLVRASSNVCLDLDVGATGDMTCVATATPLSMPYLQTGAAFDKDPTSRATFGVYKGNHQFIYLREMY